MMEYVQGGLKQAGAIPGPALQKASESECNRTLQDLDKSLNFVREAASMLESRLALALCAPPAERAAPMPDKREALAGSPLFSQIEAVTNSFNEVAEQLLTLCKRLPF